MRNIRINSFSVFGPRRDNYLTYIPLLVRQHHNFYPNWKMVLIADAPLNNQFINKMVDLNLLEVRIVEDQGKLWQKPLSGIAMLWRLLPIWDDNAEYVFCRDLDSIFTPRQLKYTTAFINSGKFAHGINDNDAHNIKLMGGMIGFKCDKFVRKFVEFENFINKEKNLTWWDKKGRDQDFLMHTVWPIVQNDFMLHKPDGPNDRWHLKDCVPGLNIDNVSEKLLNETDEFTCYIGACGICTYSLKEMCDFFDTHGNQRITHLVNS